MRAWSVVRLAACAACASCAAAPEPLALPPAAVTVEYAALGAAAAATSSPQALHIELVAVSCAPAGVAVDAAATAITRERGAPFRGASSLPPGSRWLAGEQAKEWFAQRAQLAPSQLQSLGASDVVLAPGLETRVAAACPRLPALHLRHRAESGIVVVLHTADCGDAGAEDVHLAEPLADGACALLFVPCAQREFAGHALLLQPAPPPSATAVAAASERARIVPPAPQRWPVPWQEVFRAVGEDRRRPALLALARQLSLQRCTDALLDADEEALIDVTTALADIDLARSDVAWQFERAMWRALLPRLERDELPRGLHAMFLLHFGALADDGAALTDLLDSSSDGPAMCATVRDANVDALAHHDGPMRLRAHDWLRYHGITVPDYAPFDPADKRAEALRAYQARANTTETKR